MDRKVLVGADDDLLEGEEEDGQRRNAMEPAVTGLAKLLRKAGEHEVLFVYPCTDGKQHAA